MMKTAPFIPLRDVILFPGIITPIYIGREKSIKSLERGILNENKVLLFLQKNENQENPALIEDVHNVGVLVNIIQTLKMPDKTIKVLVECKSRVKFLKTIENNDVNMVEYEELFPEIMDENIEEAIRRKTISIFERYSKMTNKVPIDVVNNIKSIKNLSKVTDMIAAHLPTQLSRKQEILEMENTEYRAYRLMEIIASEIEIIDLENRIEGKIREQVNSSQKNYYLREKIKAIKNELGEDNQVISGINEEIEELNKKVDEADMAETIKHKMKKEIKKLSKMPLYSSEASVIRTYVETIVELPWEKKTKDILDIQKAEKILEEDHYGLKDVKDRILEFLAVKKLNKNMKGSILCLAGPPGVGKTSLAKSIAKAMGRKFARISLGGVRDEAEIRGHRRTYIGSMPGRIIKEIKHIGTKNPLLLLDEIDKMSMDFRGDPSSALLEVLDSEQNKEFTDHYIDMPFDLSNVFFIATANDLGTVPSPLRDRMEIINIDSYTEYEKLNIAKKYLISQSKAENGLKNRNINFSDETILKIINEYTREAGVRNLKREIDRLFRRVAREVIENPEKNTVINTRNIKKYLGNPKYRPDKTKEREPKVGMVNGLAWTAVGGTTLEVQTVKMKGKGNLILTGKLGDIMKESAQVAYSYVRAMKDFYKIEAKFEEETDIHIHFPEGAVPKDGPSAGITITTAMISILANKGVRQDIAMSGEITISGEVLPVGGIKEKVIGAHRAGIKEVILPIDNKTDTEELPKEIMKDTKFNFVSRYEEVFEIVFDRNA